MHPRQLRVGDLVDDYCPRERRLSNHAVVALVGEDVRQVRCTTCDAEHEYKGGKVPPSRRKKAAAAPPAHDVAAPAPASDEAAPAGPPASAPIAASPAGEPDAAAPEDGQTQPPSP